MPPFANRWCKAACLIAFTGLTPFPAFAANASVSEAPRKSNRDFDHGADQSLGGHIVGNPLALKRWVRTQAAEPQSVDPLVEEDVRIRIEKQELQYLRRSGQLVGEALQQRDLGLRARDAAHRQRVRQLSRDAQLALHQQSENRFAVLYPPLKSKWDAESARLREASAALNAARSKELATDALAAARLQVDRIFRQRRLEAQLISIRDAETGEAADVLAIGVLQNKYSEYGGTWTAFFNREMQQRTADLVGTREVAERASDTTSEVGRLAMRATELTLVLKRNEVRRAVGAISRAEEGRENDSLTAELSQLEAPFAVGGTLAASAQDFTQRKDNAVLLGARALSLEWEVQAQAERAAKQRTPPSSQPSSSPSEPRAVATTLTPNPARRWESLKENPLLAVAIVGVVLLALAHWRPSLGTAKRITPIEPLAAMTTYTDRRFAIEFLQVTGEILGTEKRAETHISSSGGGGYSYQGTGHSSAPSIHSTVITKHEFWLRLADGTEKAVQLSGQDIPLRVGQRVTLVWARLSGTQSDVLSILVNHVERKHRFLQDGASLYRAFGMNRESLGLGCLGVLAFLIVISASAALKIDNYVNPWVAAIAIACAVFARVYLNLTRNAAGRRALDAHMEQKAQLAYSL